MATVSERSYGLGTVNDVMPAPLIPEHCREIPAGPVRFVVESRYLPDDMAALNRIGDRPDLPGTATLDDGGGTIHVFGTTDGVEHLRFDCFEAYPHYHYIRNDEQKNIIVRFDDIALGDPIAWSTDRLRQRLPEMLEYAGAASLAEAVRTDFAPVSSAIDSLTALLEAARAAQLARQRR
jgi:hypothetical protein